MKKNILIVGYGYVGSATTALFHDTWCEKEIYDIKTPKKKKPFLKASGISIGLAAFLVVGLSGCDGSNDSLATKQQKCKLQEYRIQHQEECDNIKERFGNTSINNSNSHSSGTSWIPMWLMMNNSANGTNSTNSNAHSGYTYGNSNSSGSTNKSSSYFSTGGSHSSSSGGS